MLITDMDIEMLYLFSYEMDINDSMWLCRLKCDDQKLDIDILACKGGSIDLSQVLWLP